MARVPRLGDSWSGRDNNFNLLRLVAATLVLVSHSFAVGLQSGAAEPFRSSLGLSLGELAVDVFFVASGFLVTASLLTRRDLVEFAAARCLRIFPGLWVSLLVTLVFFGFWVTTLDLSGFFSDRQTWRFLFKNAVLLKGIEYRLPGFPHAVNGSLWTLPSEVGMYAILALAWAALTVAKRWRASGMTVLCVAAGVVGLGADLGLFLARGESPDFYRLFARFFCGAALYVMRDRIPASRTVFAVVIAALCLSALDIKAFGVVYRLSIAYLTLYLALVPSGKIRLFNRVGDYSYGMYIYAFPVQIVTYYWWPEVGPLRLMGVSVFFTAILAYLSWELVEERSLKLKSAFQRWRLGAGGLMVFLKPGRPPS